MSSNSYLSNDTNGLIKAVQDGVKAEVVVVDGMEFVTRPVHFAPEKPDVKPLYVSTLDGLLSYLNENVDALEASEIVIVVDSPAQVTVRKQVGHEKDVRVIWLQADYELDGFAFGKFLDQETFVTQAQALFDSTPDLEKLIKYAGNLTTGNVQNSTDDGKTQTIVVESGVRKSEVDLPNPVILAPLRTFTEIAQPKSPFVVRARQTRDEQKPELALYEADGGKWRTEAIRNIEDYIITGLNKDAVKIPVIG